MVADTTVFLRADVGQLASMNARLTKCALAAALLLLVTARTAAAYGAYAAMHASPRKMESLTIFIAGCSSSMQKWKWVCEGIFSTNASQAANCSTGVNMLNDDRDGRAVLTAGSILEPVMDWLHVNDEYIAGRYLAHLFRCRNLKIVSDWSLMKGADLCYPTCGGWSNAKKAMAPEYNWNAQWFRFEVVNRPQFRGCGTIEANPELIGRHQTEWIHAKGKHGGCDALASMGAEATGLSFANRTYHSANRTEVMGLGTNPAFVCFVTVPYFTGIFAPSKDYAMAPWTLNMNRSILLGFVGATHRHPFRARFHGGAVTLARALESGSDVGGAAGLRGLSDQPAYASYYSTPVQDPGSQAEHQTVVGFYKSMRTASAFERAWALFATSVFCWQPGGDTPTRRSFYDAWLFGCIPVIQECAVKHYERIFGGHFFSHHKGATLADVVVVVRDSASPRVVFTALLSLSNAQIAKRRALLHRLAPFLQWNAATAKNAMRMFFHSVLTASPVQPVYKQ